MPPLHARPVAQAWPHVPQFRELVIRLAHSGVPPVQAVRPDEQPQVPLVHTPVPELQTVPQAPQLPGSKSVLVQNVLRVVPQVLSSDAQVVPHAPAVMSRNVACAELIHAVSLMAAEGVLQLPVISDEGEVEGLLTALDVLTWIARLDARPTPDAP